MTNFQVPAFVKAWADREGHELVDLDVHSETLSLPQLWEVDLLLLSPWETISKNEDVTLLRWVLLLEKCGRPIYYGTEQSSLSEEQFLQLSLKPRTNYRPVDCGYYDHFEAAIIKRQAQRIRLTCFGESREKGAIQQLKLLGTKTWRKEEFVEVEGHGWMRADWVDMVDVRLSGQCSING